ncbi:nucleotide exchange factor GrpE [Halofilum ochraceum]|uniref:nucleotide exchange factor GrpE n=1 Tax=Halofilum ochraceum TaxID=1611323 RepID=UPI0008D94F95|nr:nucleotide exchange factor GrpE [Halofilum ochraceum]
MSNEQSAEQRETERDAREETREQGEGETDAPDAPEETTTGEQETESAAASDDPQAEIERLRAELEQAEARADENWQRVLRTEAEKENVRKRAQKDADTARKQAVEKMANELLGVRDSLELGVDAAQQDEADIAKVREGTELTLRMLGQAMEKFDIVEINPLGEKFDPDYHQAMSMQEVEGYESNTVYQVMQKGYRLEDRLLRPALVMVAK